VGYRSENNFVWIHHQNNYVRRLN